MALGLIDFDVPQWGVAPEGGKELMAFPSLRNALNRVSNRYLLVMLSAKRAHQINRGAPARVESRQKKPTSVALEEISKAKVQYRVRDEGETKA